MSAAPHPKPARTTLLLILDACRSDYVAPDTMPYLASLRREAMTGGFVSPPGFAQRTSMFTGTYPDTSQNFSAFGYNPERSPFRWMRPFGPLLHLYQPRVFMVPARAAVKRVTKMVTGNFHTDPAWIRGPFLPFFEVVEDTKPIFEPGALPHASVFDLCREQGKRFFYGAHPVSGDDEEIYGMLLERFQKREPIELYVAQLSALDEGGHPHGPYLHDEDARAADQTPKDVERMREALAEIDRKVRVLHETMLDNYGEVNLLVLGDHGMAPVRRRVNVLDHVKRSGLKAGKDYVVFLDSTFAKFWFHSEEARRRIEPLLRDADFGRVLEQDERAKLRIDFGHRRYGDLMFAAKPGVLFWPDYFHVKERPIKGMHGYVDKDEETVGALLLHGPGIPAQPQGERVLVDVFPTLCDLVGLPVAPSNEGTSLVESAAPAAAPRAGSGDAVA